MSWIKKILGISGKTADEEAFAWAYGEAMEHRRSRQTGVKSDAALRALQLPPSCIAAFSAHPLELPGDLDICVRFVLSCKHCSSNAFSVLCYPENIVLEGEEEVLEQYPHHLLCSGCGACELLFDGMLHGYNAAIFPAESHEQEPPGQPIKAREDKYRVHVIFTYNSSLAELEETGDVCGVPAQDLFDWFHVVAVSGSGEQLKDVNYECR